MLRGRAYELKVLRSLLFGLTHLPKVGFKLLLRRDGFTPVGIVTIKRSELDTGKGLYRTFAEGVLVEEDALRKKKTFKEPLDRWNEATGTFEPIVLCENNAGIMITARRSPSIEDSLENFMYLDNPLEIDEINKLRYEAESKERTISSLLGEIESLRKEKDFWKNEAESAGTEARELRESVSRLSRELAIARAQIEFYQRQATISEGLSIQVDSAIRKLMDDARERGIDLASTDAERALASARKLRELREEMAGIVPAAVTVDEFRKMRAEVKELSEKLDKVAKEIPSPAPEKKPAGE